MTRERISVEEMLSAPRYAMEIGPEDITGIHNRFARMMAMIVDLGADIAALVPPDYWDDVSVIGSSTQDGRATAMVAVVPDGTHGMAVMVNLTYQERECPVEEGHGGKA